MKILATNNYHIQPQKRTNNSFKALVGEKEFINLVERKVTGYPVCSINSLVSIINDTKSHFNQSEFKNFLVNFYVKNIEEAGMLNKIFCKVTDFTKYPNEVCEKDLTQDLLDIPNYNKSKDSIQKDLIKWFDDFTGKSKGAAAKQEATLYDSSSNTSSDMDFWEKEEIWNKYSGYGPWDSAYT